jgi:ABC-2 type transport system permease protein
MSASAAVLRAEFRLFTREPGAIFWIVVFPTVLLVILGLVPPFREADPELGGRRVIDLYVPIVVLLSMVVAGIQTMPTVLSTYREQGILRRLSVTPARPRSLLTAQLVLHGAAVLVSVALALAVGRVAFGVRLPSHVPGYAVAAVLTMAAGLALGAAISAVSRSVKMSQTVGTVVFFPMMFTSGVWVPVQMMPPALRDVVEWTPFGATAQALDQAMAGDFPGLVHLAVTAGWAAVLIAVAVRWFRWE